MPHREGITVAEALDEVVAAATPTPVETVRLDEALGRTLAEDVRARADHPNVDNSALDGYACRAVDTTDASSDAPVRLRVIGEVPAGKPFAGSVGPREAVEIYTGGAIPTGADAIVPVEATSREDDVVLLFRPARREDIRPRGQDVQAGDLGLAAGRRLDAAAVALAAGMGHAVVSVRRPPLVGVLATGDELVAPGGTLAPGEVFNANAAGLAALVRAAGGVPHVVSRVPDDPDALADALRSGPELDVVITSGGVSMGRYDLVRDLMFDRGDVRFWKVKMKPGGPVLFGSVAGTPLLGLPGNPVSSLVTFLVFGRAFIERALGSELPPPYRRRVTAIAGAELSGSGAKEAFLRVRWERSGAQPVVYPTGSQSSGILRSMTEADALAVLPPHAQIEAGSLVEVVPLEPLLR